MESRFHVSLVSPAARSGRKPRIDDDRRAELLRRVQDAILDEGFVNLTLDEMAARAQCSKSTLYAIAPSKDLLVVTAVGGFLDDVAARAETTVAGVVGPAERITEYLTALAAGMQRMSQRCFEDIGMQDATREVYVSHSSALRTRLHAFLDEGVDAGTFRPLHSQFVADALSLMIDGIQWGRLLEGTDLSPAECYRELNEFALAALTNHAELDVPLPRPVDPGP